MKNNEFKELVDRDLSGLVWDERKRRQVLYALNEEGKPVRKISTTFILVAAIACLSVTALAAGLIFANRISVKQTAEKAVKDRYGVTGTMLNTFFGCTVDERTEKDADVTYTGTGELNYVLGEYTVTIRNGEAEATWSRDGEDTAGLFEAEAWGAEQLQEMISISAREHSIESFAAKAKAIAEKHRAEKGPEEAPWIHGGAKDAKAAAAAAGRTEESLILLAREAVTDAYGLTAEQQEKLKDPYELFGDRNVEGYWVIWYMKDGKPLVNIMLELQQELSGDPDVPNPFTEKDGRYFVDINVETGAIEDIRYSTELGGNG